LLCDLITCYSIETACFQRLKLKYDKVLSNFAFKFNLRRYSKGYDRNYRIMDAYKARRQKFYMNFVSQPLFAPGANRRWLERGGAAPLVGRCRLNR